jgi:tetratricopeptide (TPR) repeat protein
VLGNRGANGPRLRQAFETANRYLLAFFNAYVKGDQTELAFLRRDPAANGAPAGLATIRELPAIDPAPSVDAFEALIAQRGLQHAMTVFQEARRRDPKAQLFEEARLNQIGYRLLRHGKHQESITIFRTAIDLYPNSANTYDSASEALEAAGDTTQAVELSRKGLEVLAREDLPPAPRQLLKNGLEGRLRRLTSR